ncbi:MAG TPA: hypothetical protein VNL91_06330 [Thermoanaerobaculia bacterium]|nr:hypothetical protein [Thermoanaerobaculia bacterium]
MIKRLFVTVAILLAAAASFAAQGERDFLLTDGGTLYTIESVDSDSVPHLKASSARLLLLTVDEGGKKTVSAVPATLVGGMHFNPALNYDAESDTLFVFWQHRFNGGLASEVVFNAYSKGTWGPATALDDANYDIRENLRIAVTRKVEVRNEDGSRMLVPELTVHAIWWHTHGRSEEARYAMLTIEKGSVTSIALRNMSDFVSDRRSYLINGSYVTDLLRHPAVFEAGSRDAVDIVFGDVTTNTMHRVTLKPVAQGRLRIPIGVRDIGFEPPSAKVNSTGPISAISSPTSNRMVYHYDSDGAVRYVMFDGRTWSGERTLALSQTLSRDAAIDVLRRMLNTE